MNTKGVADKPHSYMQLYDIETRKNKEQMQREPEERGFGPDEWNNGIQPQGVN